MLPIPVAARSKAYVCGRLIPGIIGSNLTEGMYEGWNFNSGNYLFTTDTK